MRYVPHVYCCISRLLFCKYLAKQSMERLAFVQNCIFYEWNVAVSDFFYHAVQQPDLQIGHHADNTLASFCKWQMSLNPKDETHPNHHDVAILLTRSVQLETNYTGTHYYYYYY